MSKIQPPEETAFFSHVSDPDKRAAMNAEAPANPVDAANPEKAQASPIPDLLYSTKDLQAILDKYEEERRKALEEEIKKAQQNLPAILPQQSVTDYVNVNRDLIKTNAPQIFKQLEGFNKAEHDEMQAKGGYKPISFNKGAPSSLKILGKDNKPIYTLQYHTDGDLVIAEVPASIIKGPMHLSLALQDANGENIEADKAAYFNISYGADGKIKSMNYPEPLEFEGDRCKFLIDNQPYYLKVDKATLDALNAEIVKNRGQAKALAQDIGFEPGADDQEQQPQPQPLVHAPMELNHKYPHVPSPAPAPRPKPAPAAPQLKPAVLGGQGGGGKKDDMAVDLNAARENLKKTNFLNEKGEWHKPPAALQASEAPELRRASAVLEAHEEREDTTFTFPPPKQEAQKPKEKIAAVEQLPMPTPPQASAALKPPPPATKLGSEGGGQPTLQDLNKEAMAKAAKMAARRQVNSATATPTPAALQAPAAQGLRQTPAVLEAHEEKEETTFTFPRPKQEAEKPKEKIAVVEEQLPTPTPTPQAQPNMLDGARRIAVEELAKPAQRATRIEAPQAKTASETEMPEKMQQELRDAAKSVTQGLGQMLGNLERNAHTPLPTPPEYTLEEENLVRAFHEPDNDGKPLEGAELEKAIQEYRELQAKLKERKENQAAGEPSGSFDLDEPKENTLLGSNTNRDLLLESIRIGKQLKKVSAAEKKDASDPLRHNGGETAPKHATDEQRKILAMRDSIDTDKAPKKPAIPTTKPVRQFQPPKKNNIPEAVKGVQSSSPPLHNSTSPTSTPPPPSSHNKSSLPPR